MSQFFMLIKKEGFSREGGLLSARASAQFLLRNRIWPLWEKTQCRKMVKEGDKVLIYLAGREDGAQRVMATAIIERIAVWSREHAVAYPLMLDGIPEKVLHLKNVTELEVQIHVPMVLDKLSFVPQNKSKWGVKFMGGMRNLTKQDFTVLCGG